jgi:ubiquitin carboxyl-terminal hydrolase 25
MKGFPGLTCIRLFYGKLKQRLTAVDDARASRSSVHEKEDLFSHLPVNVSQEGYDIYDGLGGYFDDVVDLGGKKMRMEVTLMDLPPVLQIQLQVTFLSAPCAFQH